MTLSTEVKRKGQEMANQMFGGNFSAYVSYLILENLKSDFVKENFSETLNNARQMQRTLGMESSKKEKSVG